LVCLLLLFAPPAWAVKVWYDHYADGRKLARQERYKEALQAFQEAIELQPKSDLNARTYGMEFVLYVPYY
jgi:tetratricopeptide (TPR) repeat protein